MLGTVSRSVVTYTEDGRVERTSGTFCVSTAGRVVVLSSAIRVALGG